MEGVSQQIWQELALTLKQSLESAQKNAQHLSSMSSPLEELTSPAISRTFSALNLDLPEDYPLSSPKRSYSSLGQSDLGGYVLLDEKKTIAKVVGVFNRFDLEASEMDAALKSVKQQISSMGFPDDIKHCLEEAFDPLITVYSESTDHAVLSRSFVMDRRMVPMIDVRENHAWAESTEMGKGFWNLSRSFTEEAQEIIYRFFRGGLLGGKRDFVSPEYGVDAYIELAHFAQMSIVPALSKMVDSELVDQLGSFANCYQHLREFYLYLIATSSQEMLSSAFKKCENILLAFYIHGAAQPDQEVLQHVTKISRRCLPNFHSTKLLSLIPYLSCLETIEVNYLYQEHIDLLELHCPHLHEIVSYKSSFQSIPQGLAQRLTLLSLDNNKQVTELYLYGSCKLHLDRCYRLDKLIAVNSEDIHLSQCYNLAYLLSPKVEKLHLEGCVLLREISVPLVKRYHIKGCESLEMGLPPPL